MSALILINMVLIVAVVFFIIKLQSMKKELLEMKKWQSIALCDDLTKIPNRAAYSRHIKELQDMKERDVSLILVDIDDFKETNDTYGHLEGDRLLRECAAMLCDVFSGKEFIVYRIGGDEFAIIAHKVSEQLIIDKMLETRRREEAGEISFNISKGYAISDGKVNFTTMFKRADEMLYADKMYKYENNMSQN